MISRWLRKRRRAKVLKRSFPDDWSRIIDNDVKAAAKLTEEERTRLEQLVQVFIAEKRFEGCGGLQMNDRIRVVIAAQACLLILGLDHDFYRRVESILVYPSTVYPPQRKQGFFDPSVEIVQDGPSSLLGEAHYRGPVIIAWDAARQGAYNPTDGRNVVYHEFAHKLDMLSGSVDGTPPLESSAQVREWADAFREAYETLRSSVSDGEKTYLQEYAATNEAEFFAVATEHFFEQPQRMFHEHPEVYRAMADFFHWDPVGRS